MTDLIIRNGRYVFPDPSVPGDGGAPMEAGQAAPIEHGVQINGAPVIEKFHEYVMKKKPDAKDQ